MNISKFKSIEQNSIKKEYFKFVLVILFIVSSSYFLYLQTPQTQWTEFMRLFMGVFLVVFAGFKFVGYKSFWIMFSGYDIVSKKFPIYGKIYPFLELSLGLAFLLNFSLMITSWILFIVMATASIGVFKEIYKRKTGVYCACLGNVIKLPLSTISLFENVSMASMAGLMLVF